MLLRQVVLTRARFGPNPMSPLLARVETTGALEERHEVSPPRRTASRAITPAAARGQTGPGQQQGGEEGWGRSSAGRSRHVGRGLGGLEEHQLTLEGDVLRSRLEKRLRARPIGLDARSATTAVELEELNKQEGPGQGGQRGWTPKGVQPAHRPAAGKGGGAARDGPRVLHCNLSCADAHGLDLGALPKGMR